MRIFLQVLRLGLLVSGSLAGTTALAATTMVDSQSDYSKAVKNLNPGDTIVLANGTWKDFEILFTGTGTADKPITLTVQDKGKVIISGQSNLRLAGEHLVVSGLVFRDGYTPRSEVISFRRNKEHLAHHSRVTEVVIDSFNNPERTETDFWVMMYGRNNRFDHNHLQGKSNNGVTMAVRLDREESQQNHHRIDHNYFGPRPVLGSNGGETLRIGTSKYSLSDSFTTVENNYFERCNGEVEIISNKSGGNVFRGNVFLESRGTLTLRHGNDSIVEDNIFIGNGVDHTGGIRVINKRQTVRNNYLQGLTGNRFGSALTIMNGVPDSPINRYHQVEDSLIENNTIIDSQHIELAAGSDKERSATPRTTTFRNNLIYNKDGNNVFTVNDDISGITFTGNVTNIETDLPFDSGFSSQPIALQASANGLLRPKSADLANVGASADLQVLPRDMTGVSWYPKPTGDSGLGTGPTVAVSPAEGALEQAVAEATPGTILELAAGDYLVQKLIPIDKPVTIRADQASLAASNKPAIEFERTALFEIQDGGSLQLENLRLSGASAPDNAGNSLIRTSKYSMLTPYFLLLDQCEVEQLDVNHSFNFLTVAKGTFAMKIAIRNSQFSDISGAILELEKETDDLGLYNVEYVSITDSVFENIGEALAVLYRGGTDESTFGPHFELRDSTLNSVGNSKRNRTQSSVSLHGVQFATIADNEFIDSQPIRAMLTVGEPRTAITGNRFIATPAPVIENGEAFIQDNVVSQP